MVRRFNSRFPTYPDDADYTTNAPSYYDDLARKNKLIKELAERIGFYDIELEKHFKEVQEILDKVIEKIGEGFNEEIYILLEKWVEDGTLDFIINETLMNKKADITYVDQIFNNLEKYLNEEIDNMNDKLENELKEKIDNLAYYHELEVKTYRDTDLETTYYIVKIPKKDSNGEPIVLKHGIASDKFSSVGTETVREFSKRKEATFVSNLSPSTTRARIIHKGEILNNLQADHDYRPTLAFNDSGEMRSYGYEISAQEILSDGYTEAMTTFSNLITNGSINTLEINKLSDYLKNVNPRTVVAQDSTGNNYIMVSDGRRIGERGFTAMETAQVLISHRMSFAQMLDGGGSTQATLYHSNINKLSDRVGSRNDGFIIGQNERSRSNFLYVGKDKKDDPLTKILSNIGDINKIKDDRLSEYENLQYTSTNWIELEKYLINGWENYSGSGSNAVRGWILPNNTLYLVGTITGGTQKEGDFMQLPPELTPNFGQHFLTCGNSINEIYKIITTTGGILRWYYWTSEAQEKTPDYIKLDGIFFPINPDYNSGV